MLNIASRQGKANQNHKEISLHTCREENFTDSAHSYPTSYKFGRLIFSCDAHPIGEHEVQ